MVYLFISCSRLQKGRMHTSDGDLAKTAPPFISPFTREGKQFSIQMGKKTKTKK